MKRFFCGRSAGQATDSPDTDYLRLRPFRVLLFANQSKPIIDRDLQVPGAEE